MASCLFCGLIKKQQPNTIVSNDAVVALLDKRPSVAGQIIVLTRNHYPLLSQIPDRELAELLGSVKKISQAMLRTYDVAGTTVLGRVGVEAGQIVPHASLVVMPRYEGDGVGLDVPVPASAGCNLCQMEGVSEEFGDADTLCFQLEGFAGLGVATRAHYPILEAVPDQMLEPLGRTLKEAIQLMLSNWNASAVTVLLHNGIPAGQRMPHAVFWLIAREKNDGRFSLPERAVGEEDTGRIVSAMREALVGMGGPVGVETMQSAQVSNEVSDYLLEKLKRVP